MTSLDATAQLWDAERPRLTGLAYRILGSWHEAEDVVAQAWPRLADQEGLERPQAWLTTVVTRLAIDAGRRATARRESYTGSWLPEPVATGRLPEDAAEARSLLSLAMLRLMDTLPPEDRAVFMLHEAFGVSYDEISECVGRSPAACRQVVSRARRSLRAADLPAPDPAEDRRLLTALVDAISNGDVTDVVRLVSEDCVLWADGGGVAPAARRPLEGVARVAPFLVGLGRWLHDAREVEVNGQAALVFPTARGEYLFTVERDGTLVGGIQVQANPAKLQLLGPARGDSGGIGA